MTKEKRDKNNKNFSPGPSDYNVHDIHKKSPMTVIGKQKRTMNKRSESPGPADYKIPCSIRDVPTFVRKKGAFDEHYTYV